MGTAMLVTSVLSALFLNVVIVQRATEGRVHVDGAMYVRIASCSALALLAGAGMHAIGARWPTVARMPAAAVPAAIVYMLAAQTFGLSPEARAELMRRLRRSDRV
jgi:phage terminase small subunit